MVLLTNLKAGTSHSSGTSQLARLEHGELIVLCDLELRAFSAFSRFIAYA